MKQVETIVIGSGPGGYVAAIRAAQLGQKVTLVEKGEIGGVCLNVGCIPSKALITAGHRYQESKTSQFLGLKVNDATLDFSQTQKWKDETVVKSLTAGIKMLLQKNQVEIVHGKARFTSQKTVIVSSEKDELELAFEQAIVATGSQPIEITGFPFGNRIIDSTGGLNLKEVPKKLVIIGGGVIGSELGGAYANLGSQVTILEGSEQLLPSYEKDLVNFVEKDFKQKGVKVVTKALAREAKLSEEGVKVIYEHGGKEEEIEADYVMVTVGRQPNTKDLGLEKAGITVDSKGLIPVNKHYQTQQKHILAIGDVIAGLALAHKASYDGKIAGEVVSGKIEQKDYLALPTMCFTDPELATTGLTLQEAKSQKYQATAFQFPLQGNGRALSLNQTTGFIRVVVEDGTKQILGGQIVGVNASELITEISLAIENNLTVTDLALTIHGHPTLGEAVMDTMELAQGLPIHF